MEIDLKQEFFFQGNQVGCLLIHGFSSTPAEMYELGLKIKNVGYTVLGIRLEGHGTTVEEMKKCNYRKWIKSVEEGYEKLRKTCSKIYVIGHSMGGLLSLYAGENFEVDKIIALAPALSNTNRTTNLAGIVKYFMKYAEWPPSQRPEGETRYLLGYNKFPVASVHELNKLKNVVIKGLNKITKPVLAIQSNKDTVVHTRGIAILENGISSKEFKKVLLYKCGHNITIECEKERVFEEVLKFII